MPLATLALFVSTAVAHYPHDVAFYVALSPTNPPTWIATSLYRREEVMSARSDNFADVEVYYVYGGGIVDEWGDPVEPRAGEFLDEARLFMASSGLGLWESLDAGKSWMPHADLDEQAVLNSLESSPGITTDGTALLAGYGGIWVTRDRGDSWSLVADTPGEDFVDVAFSPGWASDGTACAATRLADVWCSDDFGESWAFAGSSGSSEAWQLALDDSGRIWLGVMPGLLMSDDGGASWSSVSIHPSVDVQPITTLEYVGDGVLLTATEMEAVWRSGDGGDTWTLQGRDLQTPVTTFGHDVKHYFEFQRAEDGIIWLATQEGLAWSDDLGLGWTAMETELGDTLRGLVIAEGTEVDNPLVLTGNYGSGVNVVDAALTEVTNISHDLEWLYLRSLCAPDDWVDNGVVMVTGSGRLYVSNDYGASWERTMDTDRYPNLVRAAPDYGSDPLLLLAAGTEAGGALYRSTDHGQTWVQGTLEGGECTGGAKALTFSPDFRSDGLALATCGDNGALFVTEDAGVSWSWVGSTGVNVGDLAASPGAAEVFLATDAGLWISRDLAEPVLLGWEGEPVWGVAASPDWSEYPYVYVITIHDGWHRSSDGGASFQRLAAASDQIPIRVAISPSFGSDGTVAISGYGGMWISRDRGEAWTQGHALELYQETQHQLLFDRAEWSPVGDEAVASSDPSAELTVQFRGVGFDLVGPTRTDGGSFEISVDDDEPAAVSTQGEDAERQDLWSYSNLEDGWHRVVVVPMGDAEVVVDAARIWKIPGVEPGPDWMTGDTDTDTDADTDTDVDADADADTDSPEDTDPGDSDDTPPAHRCGGCSSASVPMGGLTALILLGVATLRRRPRRRCDEGTYSCGQGEAVPSIALRPGPRVEDQSRSPS